MVECNRAILKHCQENNMFINEKLIKEGCTIGFWKIVIPNDIKTPISLVIDDIIRKQLGIDDTITLEEVYSFWYNRIQQDDKEAINDIMASIVNLGQVDGTYHWEHPEKGIVSLRCGGYLGKKSRRGYYLYGYHQYLGEK